MDSLSKSNNCVRKIMKIQPQFEWRMWTGVLEYSFYNNSPVLISFFHSYNWREIVTIPKGTGREVNKKRQNN